MEYFGSIRHYASVMDDMVLACRVIDLFLEAELVQEPDIHTANRYAAIDYTLHWYQFIPRSRSVQRTPPAVIGPLVFFPFLLKFPFKPSITSA